MFTGGGWWGTKKGVKPKLHPTGEGAGVSGRARRPGINQNADAMRSACV